MPYRRPGLQDRLKRFSYAAVSGVPGPQVAALTAPERPRAAGEVPPLVAVRLRATWFQSTSHRWDRAEFSVQTKLSRLVPLTSHTPSQLIVEGELPAGHPNGTSPPPPRSSPNRDDRLACDLKRAEVLEPVVSSAVPAELIAGRGHSTDPLAFRSERGRTVSMASDC